jgi:Rps23 Pro-64 3,4-dihydroxylase Tpa1-like proline 4-hydroxylase
MGPEQSKITRLILERLDQESEDIVRQWNNPVGTTTRHFVIDELLPQELAQSAYESFPRDAQGFFSRGSFREKKRTSATLSDYAPILGDMTYAVQDPAVVAKVAELCGLRQIEPDPELYAGGLSMMFQGDFLNPHIDNSHDGKRDRYRRLNLLYYVSPDWKLENGGNFELWDESRTAPKTIVSKQNRFLVMETNKTSWHSVSRVVVDRPRCCVSNYFFSKVSPDQTDYFHVTSFAGRPDEPVKRAISVLDNALRNVVAAVFKIGRGKHLVNKSRPMH